MSVYVDELSPCLVSAKWRWPSSCHLYADTIAELHEFAAQIGMRRVWFQDRRDFPHYDLNASRRLLAVRAGAIQVDRRHVVNTLRANRERRLSAALTM